MSVLSPAYPLQLTAIATLYCDSNTSIVKRNAVLYTILLRIEYRDLIYYI